MKKNIDYDQEDGEIELIEMCASELSDLIENKIDNKPKGRPSAAFRKSTNELIDLFNSKFGKCYTRI